MYKHKRAHARAYVGGTHGGKHRHLAGNVERGNRTGDLRAVIERGRPVRSAQVTKLSRCGCIVSKEQRRETWALGDASADRTSGWSRPPPPPRSRSYNHRLNKNKSRHSQAVPRVLALVRQLHDSGPSVHGDVRRLRAAGVLDSVLEASPIRAGATPSLV